LRDFLKRQGRIRKKDILKIIKISKKKFDQEGNILHTEDPLTIVGDIHGQFYDLIKLIKMCGSPKKRKYVFLGDYVDRGNFSIEVLLLLLSLKINFPGNILMLRGNHESKQMTSNFNFRKECLYKYDQEIYKSFIDLFNSLPLGCVINKRFITFHGGISPQLKSLEDLNKINRFKEPPGSGLFCDLLWSDPVEKDSGEQRSEYIRNEKRGCSFTYGRKALTNFLARNKLGTLIRAHEVQIEGYKMFKWGEGTFPNLITLFSAPNYCDSYNNKGAVIKLSNDALNITQISFSEHPYYLPDFMNIFSWSLPFVSEKTVEMFVDILKKQAKHSKLDKENIDAKGLIDKGKWIEKMKKK